MTNSEDVVGLDSLRAMLQPDGYDLVVVGTDGDEVDLEVVAGPDACADCLVPKPVFEEIIAMHIAPAGRHLRALAYPPDSDVDH